ncbi:M13 family metallopeptidase [Aquipuribacter sp. SD81]|uniref:M13 family metallopeptidase n=1 Tax=Aquipuribacter sp. SD81 TaxID=3127703 RepID=UPI003018C488
MTTETTAPDSTPEATGPLAHLDPSVRPQDDLFRHVNGRWLETAEIPSDRAAHGSFYLLREQSEADVRTIIEESAASQPEPGSNAQKVGDLYASFMDTERIEALGTEPLRPVLARVDAAEDVEGLLRLFGELEREGIGGAFGSYVWVDKGDPTRYLLHLSQGGISLPDESYYREEQHAAIRDAFPDHVARMLTLAGVAEGEAAEAAARTVLALETRVAASHWDTVASRDAVKTYNLRTGEKLDDLLPGWRHWADGVGVPEAGRAEVVVGEPEALEGLAAALRELPLEDWRTWLRWRVVTSMAAYLPDALVAQNFAFYGTTLSGVPQIRERWKRGVSLVEGVLGEAVGELYVERHYPPAAHRRMTELVDNLIAAYRERIDGLDWMSPETKARAQEKLRQFTPKIGYPVRWRDYAAVEIEAGDLLGNVRRATAAETVRELEKLGAPIDRDEWLMTPQTVNAYYNPALNEIVFPAAILQPPFFDLEADDAYNYGGIGAVIGHEIGHGFDDQGSRYDGTGALVDWWTEEDRERFEERTKALVTQYDAFSPEEAPDTHVNGAFTLGENIGDLGGAEVALHAYRISLGGQEAPVVDGLTGEQRFFVGFGHIWQQVTRPEEVRRRITIDPHSPAEFRANVVRNVDAFHTAFGTEPGDGLWLDPTERVRIW